MNRRSSLPATLFARVRFLFFIICALGVLCGESSAQDFKTAHDGVEYARVDHKLGTDPVKINLLRLDLKKVRLDVHHAMDAAIGTEKTSSIAVRHGAVAAINAGFFRLDKSPFLGDAAGALMIDGSLLSESSNGRIGLYIWEERKETHFEFGHLNTSTSVLFGIDEPELWTPVSGINRERKKEEIILYDSRFSYGIPSEANGLKIRISDCNVRRDRWGLLITACKKVERIESTAKVEIPTGSFIISCDSESPELQTLISELNSLFSKPKKKQKALLRTIVKSAEYDFIQDKSTDIIAGVPQLIKNGRKEITWEQEKSSKAFVETRHPRTAVAKLKNGKFLMITVDGRQPGVSVGMNLYELADYLLSIGAVDAMNLDGGGSTTMFLDGKVVNKPSDKEGERKVSDAILVTLRKGKLK